MSLFGVQIEPIKIKHLSCGMVLNAMHAPSTVTALAENGAAAPSAVSIADYKQSCAERVDAEPVQPAPAVAVKEEGAIEKREEGGENRVERPPAGASSSITPTPVWPKTRQENRMKHSSCMPMYTSAEDALITAFVAKGKSYFKENGMVESKCMQN